MYQISKIRFPTNHLGHLLVLVLALGPWHALAQVYENDARLWLTVDLTKRINKKLDAELLLQNRLNNNMTQYSGYTSWSLSYKLNSHVKCIVGYVLGARHELDGNYSPIQQAFAGFQLKQNWRKLSFTYRNLTQSQQRGLPGADYGSSVKLFNRNKFQIKYEFTKRWEVYGSLEAYFTLADRARYETIARKRYLTGVNYTISKQQNIEAYFLFQQNYPIKNLASRNFIYGITFHQAF